MKCLFITWSPKQIVGSENPFCALNLNLRNLLTEHVNSINFLVLPIILLLHVSDPSSFVI